MSKFLDQDGLAYLWGKLKTKFASLDSNGKIKTSQLPSGLGAMTYTDHSVTVTYASGTVGTRGQASALSVSSSVLNNYNLVGFIVLQNEVSASMHTNIVCNPSSSGEQRIYLVAYRATTGAVSNSVVKVRLLWKPK